MFLLILWLAFFSLWALLARAGMGLRLAFLAAQVVNGVLIVFVTETLSAFQSLTPGPLAIFWSLVLLINLAWFYRLRGRKLAVRFFQGLSALEVALVAGVGVVIAITGFIALGAPPNNYDSMVYHLARVAHWAFNGTTANYPTHTLLQLVLPPYSEYAILQGYILSGTDFWANLVQWNSSVASLVGVSVITQILGGARRAQLWAVLLAATLPMGILQASSTQNDYQATLWAVCCGVFALQLVSTGRLRWGILCAMALALATLTKGIAVIISVPFLLWACWKVNWEPRRKAVLVLLIFSAVLAVNSPFWFRLMEVDRSPVAAMKLGGSAVVERLDIRGTVSNAVRGMATELSFPSATWQRHLQSLVEEVHRRLSLDINDPAFTVPGSSFAVRHCDFFSEEYATSGLHTIIYLLVAGYLLLGWGRSLVERGTVRSPGGWGKGDGRDAPGGNQGPPHGLSRSFLAVLVVAVLLFWTLVKWQEGIVRFHLPFYVLFSAVAATVLGKIPGRYQLVLCGALFASAFAPLLNNQQRSMVPYGAVTRQSLEPISGGGGVFDWLRKNGYFRRQSEGAGYFKDNVGARLSEEARAAFPVRYAEILAVLQKAPSFPEGFWLIPRHELFFSRFSKISRDEIGLDLEFMKQQLDKAPDCRDIGYIKGAVQYEYPLWGLLHSQSRTVRIEHILVDNVSRKFKYPRGEPVPCLIVKEGWDEAETLVFQGRTYRRGSPGPFQVYVAEHAE